MQPEGLLYRQAPVGPSPVPTATFKSSVSCWNCDWRKTTQDPGSDSPWAGLRRMDFIPVMSDTICGLLGLVTGTFARSLSSWAARALIPPGVIVGKVTGACCAFAMTHLLG